MVAGLSPGQAMNTADTLAKESWNRWSREKANYVDDITVLLVYLQQENEPSP